MCATNNNLLDANAHMLETKLPLNILNLGHVHNN
jgi:hypothetical protein